MANLEQIVSRKAENDTKWKEAQQAERENTTAMQDARRSPVIPKHTPAIWRCRGTTPLTVPAISRW